MDFTCVDLTRCVWEIVRGLVS